MAIQMLIVTVLLPLVLPAIVLFLIAPRWPILLAWVFCLVALFIMGINGRPGVVRVYVPLISLLLIAPLLIKQVKGEFQRGVIALALFLGCAGQGYILIPKILSSMQMQQQVQQELRNLPTGPIVSWGAAFPYELAFPVLSNDHYSRNIKLYPLGSFTQAPFSVFVASQKPKLDLIERLRTNECIPIIASEIRMSLLRVYCRERLNGHLHTIITYQTPSLTVQQVRCEIGK